MRFIKRLSASLFKPKDIVHFRMDSFWLLLLYILALSIITTIPTTIINIKNSGLNYNIKKDIRSAIVNEGEIPFIIQNDELIATGNNDVVYEASINNNFMIVVSLNNKYNNDLSYTKAIIFINSDGIYLKQALTSIHICDYSDYEVLKNLDLRLANTNDSTFWDSVFFVAEKEIDQYKNLTVVLSSILTFIMNIGSMIILSLIMSLAASFLFAGIVPFKEIWRMYVYLITPYVIGNLLSTLFGISIFYYIGIVMMLIYAFAVSQAIVKIKIRKD